jgi:Xaa-Pro aminopeptidase
VTGAHPTLSDALPPLAVAGRVGRVREAPAEAVPDDGDASGRPPDALVVTSLVNARYLTGFTGSSAVVAVLPDELVLVTDGRYRDRAAAEVAASGAPCRVLAGETVAAQHELLRSALGGLERVAVEGHVVSLAQHTQLQRALGLPLTWCTDVVEGIRRTKDAGEIARLERAAAITDRALAETLPLLGTEPTERALQLALDRRIEDLGADSPSFATIVASGPNAARPHHLPGDRRIVAGDTVIIDVGATVDGYHSDMTRTVVVGPPTALQAEAYEAVRRAQAAGVAAARPGLRTEDLDALVRQHLTDDGWGPWFTHGTGHGIGLLIHEMPWITRNHTGVLRTADVVTVEPGVYREDLGGVRIEDSVVITDDGCRPITHSPKDPSCPPSPPTT